MDLITTDHIRGLVELSSPVEDDNSKSPRSPMISIYAPMYRAGREVQQNEIRFGNAITEAENRLQQSGYEADDIRDLLRPARELLENDEFWQHQSDGLAVFISRNESRWWRLPVDFEESLTVGDSWHIKPLLNVITDDHQWYILAVSPERVRLLQASMHGVEDLEPANFPDNLRDALNIDEYVSTLQFHSTSREMFGAKRTDAIHHGQGGSDPDVKKQDELLQYFHRLDDALRNYLDQQVHPLVFAGVEYLFPIFKEACDYDNIVDEPLTGNPDDLTAEELHSKSRKIMRERIRDQASKILAEYQEKSHTDFASDDPVLIYHAARMGQVGRLIITPDQKLPVEFDEDRNPQLLAKATDESVDLSNFLAIHTLTNGGKVVMSKTNTQSGVAAVFRSPAVQFAGQSGASDR